MKKKTQSSFVFGQRLICCSRAPELRDTARTESRDFKSSQCPPSPASETTGKTNDALFSIRRNQYISVAPPKLLRRLARKPQSALFWKNHMAGIWSESFFICSSNMLQELEISGEVFLSSRCGFQQVSCMLMLEKLEWKEKWMKKQEVKPRGKK